MKAFATQLLLKEYGNRRWPSNSYDLKICEQVGAIVQRRVDGWWYRSIFIAIFSCHVGVKNKNSFGLQVMTLHSLSRCYDPSQKTNASFLRVHIEWSRVLNFVKFTFANKFLKKWIRNNKNYFFFINYHYEKECILWKLPFLFGQIWRIVYSLNFSVSDMHIYLPHICS